MKTIRQKAKAYDEAVEGIQEILSNGQEFINMSRLKLMLQPFFSELKESEDEQIKKRIIQSLHGDVLDIEETNKAIAWLEKQGEHKHIAEEVLIKAGLKPYKDGNQWCVLLGDNIQEGICGFGNTVEDALYAFLKDLIASQSEQKPVDKVRLKFKDGDLVTSDDESVFNITIDNNKYQLETLEGTSCHYSYEIIEERFRLWTIQDAKEGDILANDRVICVYKERVSEHVIKVTINYSRREDIETHYEVIENFNLYHATKEECDFFFSKLKSEVGV